MITFRNDKHFGLVLWSPQQDLTPFSPSFSPCTNGHNADTDQYKRILLLTAKEHDHIDMFCIKHQNDITGL